MSYYAIVVNSCLAAVSLMAIHHTIAMNNVDNIERSLKRNNADPTAFEPINEWRRKPFFKQLFTKPTWNKN